MLTLYRRHKTGCPHTDRYLKLDAHRCPVWVEGMIEGVYHRHSLKVSSWDKAEQIRRQLEQGKPATVPSIDAALDVFLAEQKARALSEATQSKLKVLARYLRAFCAERRITMLPELDLARTREFRNSWKDSPISALKKLERLRSFFGFCVASGWRQDNPARILKNPIVTNPPTLPFTDAEVQSFLAHATASGASLRSCSCIRVSGWGTPRSLRRNSCRTEDCFSTPRRPMSRFTFPCRSLFCMSLRISRSPAAIISGKESPAPRLDTASGNARRAFRKIFKAANISHGHPHRFRDTFAVRLLQAGVPLQDVSILLGHSSVKVTEKHYAPWVSERQARLEELVQRTWKTQLLRVK